MLGVNAYNLCIWAGLGVVALGALVLCVYLVVWIASRAFHDARYGSVARYGKGLALRQRKNGSKQNEQA